MGKKMNVTTASARGEELWEKRTKETEFTLPNLARRAL
jgi:hypothetical protein